MLYKVIVSDIIGLVIYNTKTELMKMKAVCLHLFVARI